MERFHGTTVLAVRRGGRTAVAADGQVTLDKSIVKAGARKVRRLAGGRVIAGFAGGAADAFALLTRFEEKLDEFSGRLE
ncbi:MAG TPA: HslU--HslV peptidase proteolytic subunit, partial [Acidobacteriota bacterium]|nr:HslU--HslV peptidase proteolytic subunit [Acidobacteriota bacterium]